MTEHTAPAGGCNCCANCTGHGCGCCANCK